MFWPDSPAVALTDIGQVVMYTSSERSVKKVVGEAAQDEKTGWKAQKGDANVSLGSVWLPHCALLIPNVRLNMAVCDVSVRVLITTGW